MSYRFTYQPVIKPLNSPRSGPTDYELFTQASEQDEGVREALRAVLPEARDNERVIYPRERDLDIFLTSLATLGYAITPIEGR